MNAAEEAIFRHEVATRLAQFHLNEQAARRLRPFQPNVDALIDDIIRRYCFRQMKMFPATKPMYETHMDEIVRVEGRHFRQLAAAKWDETYIQSLMDAGRLEWSLGIGTTLRITVATRLGSELLKLVVRRRLLNVSGALADFLALSSNILCDITNSVSFEHRLAQTHALSRAGALDDALSGFNTKAVAMTSAIVDAASDLKTVVERNTSETRHNLEALADIERSLKAREERIRATAVSAQDLQHAGHSIAREADESARKARDALDGMQATSQSMMALANAAEKIGSVVGMISEIAEQTNLLALNATIEAARAGEAGRGFSVVAHEVKALASQTAKATEDISLQVAAIQSAAARSADQLDGFTDTILAMTEMASGISSAVERQQSTAEDIARSSEDTADNTAAIGTRTASVMTSLSGLTELTEQVNAVASLLVERSEDIGVELGAFRERVKSA
ncbi:MAG: hypothetical protein K2P80_06770 [Beijerinckiaceae bacterium]|nr:hypothetical protein [Beijerinckiaceae bacterium]